MLNWYSKHSAILSKSHSSRLIFRSVCPLSKYWRWNYGAYYLQAKLSLKQYCTPEIACNFIFSTKTPSKNLTLKKRPPVNMTSRSKVMPVFGFPLWRYHRQTIKIGENFLCNSLLHRNERLLLSGKVLRPPSLKSEQNEKDYSLTLKFLKFCKIFGERCETGAPFWCQFSKFFKAVSK